MVSSTRLDALSMCPCFLRIDPPLSVTYGQLAMQLIYSVLMLTFAVLPASTLAATDIGYRLGGLALWSDGPRPGAECGIEWEGRPGFRLKADYVYATHARGRVSGAHGLRLLAQGRLDLVNLVPWVALGPNHFWLTNQNGLGFTVQLGIDVLHSPTFSFGGYLGYEMALTDHMASIPVTGIFVSWSPDALNAF